MDKDIDMKTDIKVKYSCDQCGLKNIEVAVPVREDEDVVTWARQIVGSHISNHHARRSPKCSAKSVQNLMIPTDGTNKIGGQVIQ